MKKTIAILGLLLAGCDNSQAEVRSVEYFLKNYNDRLLVSQECARKKNDHPECQNAIQAFVLEDIQSYKPEELTVEGFMDIFTQASDAADRYCITNYNLEKTHPNFYRALPLDHPICQNFIKAVKQGYEKCLAEKSNFAFATACGNFKEYIDEINAKKIKN